MQMNRLVVIAAASILVIVIAATLFLYTGGTDSQVSEIEALEAPADLSLIYTNVNRDYNTVDGSFIVVHENVIDSRRHCEFCSVIEFHDRPAGGSTEVSWSADRDFSMQGAGKITFYAMGEEGGETVQFKAAGARLGLGTLGGTDVGDVLSDTVDFAIETRPVTLTDEWQQFEIDLSGENLTSVRDALAVEVGDGQTATVWIKGLTLEEGPAPDALAEAEADG